jgi:uncharacterized protein DUF1206
VGASASKSADTSGALKTLADQPFGKILLWLVALGLVALALWQASEVIWGYRNREAAKRVRKQVTSGGMAVIYAGLGVSASLVALGSGSSSSQSQQQATSGVLAWPGGQVIVVVAGLIIIGVGVAGVVKGVKTPTSPGACSPPSHLTTASSATVTATAPPRSPRANNAIVNANNAIVNATSASAAISHRTPLVCR